MRGLALKWTLACACSAAFLVGTPASGAALAPQVSTGAVTAVTTTSATLTGSVNPEGQATTYYFQYGPTAAYGSQTPVQSAGSGATSVAATATVGSLTPNSSYHYRLVAINATGTGYGSDASFKTASALPPAVTTGAVAAVTTTSATLTGSVNPEGQATTYYFQYGPTAAYGSQTPVVNAGSAATSVAATAAVGSLTPNRTYHYRLVGSNATALRVGADHVFRTAKPSSVTLVASPATITFGQTTVLSGGVGAPAAAFAVVTLQAAARSAGPFGNLTTTIAGAKGAYGFAPIAPASNTYFRTGANGSSSTPVLVRVRFRITLSASTTHPKRGQRVRFRGRVGPRHNGLRVFVQRLGPKRRWHTIARTRLRATAGNASVYSLHIHAGRSGLYRAVVGPDASHTRGSSRAVRIRVHG
jgi:hypothetical protein